MGQTIAGGVVGAITGIAQAFIQHRDQKRQQRLAEKQFEAARQQSINEEQARAKVNAREPDVDSILAANTDDRNKTDLTGGATKNRLFKPIGKLGGINGK